MSIVKRAVLPAVVAATLVAGSASVAFAAAGAPQPDGGRTTVAQETKLQRQELTPERICRRVADSDRPHPVLGLLCWLYADPTMPPDAKQQIGNAIVSIVEHRLDRRDDRRDGQPRPPRVRPAATATPAN